MPPGLPVAHEHTILELMGQPRRAIFPGKAFRFEKGPVSLHIIRMDDRFAPEPHQLAENALHPASDHAVPTRKKVLVPVRRDVDQQDPFVVVVDREPANILDGFGLFLHVFQVGAVRDVAVHDGPVHRFDKRTLREKPADLAVPPDDFHLEADGGLSVFIGRPDQVVKALEVVGVNKLAPPDIRSRFHLVLRIPVHRAKPFRNVKKREVLVHDELENTYGRVAFQEFEHFLVPVRGRHVMNPGQLEHTRFGMKPADPIDFIKTPFPREQHRGLAAPVEPWAPGNG